MQTPFSHSDLFLQNYFEAKLKIIQDKEKMEKEQEDKKLRAEEKQKQKEIRRIQRVKELCFDKYDTNNDGVLEVHELKQYIKEICNRNNMPEPAEYFYTMLFNSCDDDKNQTLDFDEFMKHFGQHAIIVE